MADTPTPTRALVTTGSAASAAPSDNNATDQTVALRSRTFDTPAGHNPPFYPTPTPQHRLATPTSARLTQFHESLSISMHAACDEAFTNAVESAVEEAKEECEKQHQEELEKQRQHLTKSASDDRYKIMQECESLKEEIKSLAEDKKKQAESIKNLTEENQDLRERNRNLGDGNNTLLKKNREMQKLQGQNTTNEKQNKDLQDAILKLKGDKKHLRENKEDLKGEIIKLQKDLDVAKKRLGRFNALHKSVVTFLDDMEKPR
ncbi:hypothetical protein SLS54_003599 [Diplodia seriata]